MTFAIDEDGFRSKNVVMSQKRLQNDTGAAITCHTKLLISELAYMSGIVASAFFVKEDHKTAVIEDTNPKAL